MKTTCMWGQIGQILIKKPIFEEPPKIVHSRSDPLETFPKGTLDLDFKITIFITGIFLAIILVHA